MRGDKPRKVHGGTDFPGGPVVKTLPPSAGVTGSIPGQECNKVRPTVLKKKKNGHRDQVANDPVRSLIWIMKPLKDF